MKRATSMVIILVFILINLELSESRIFMTPNVWLTTEEFPKKEIENLNLGSPQNVVNDIGYKVQNLKGLKNIPVEENEQSPFPKGKKHLIHLYFIFEKLSLKLFPKIKLDKLDF